MQIAELSCWVCLLFTALYPESLALVLCVPDSSAVFLLLASVNGRPRKLQEWERTGLAYIFQDLIQQQWQGHCHFCSCWKTHYQGSNSRWLGWHTLHALTLQTKVSCHCFSIPKGTSKPCPCLSKEALIDFPLTHMRWVQSSDKSDLINQTLIGPNQSLFPFLFIISNCGRAQVIYHLLP